MGCVFGGPWNPCWHQRPPRRTQSGSALSAPQDLRASGPGGPSLPARLPTAPRNVQLKAVHSPWPNARAVVLRTPHERLPPHPPRSAPPQSDPFQQLGRAGTCPSRRADPCQLQHQPSTKRLDGGLVLPLGTEAKNLHHQSPPRRHQLQAASSPWRSLRVLPRSSARCVGKCPADARRHPRPAESAAAAGVQSAPPESAGSAVEQWCLVGLCPRRHPPNTRQAVCVPSQPPSTGADVLRCHRWGRRLGSRPDGLAPYCYSRPRPTGSPVDLRAGPYLPGWARPGPFPSLP
mmetsp:Transcript_54541/g.119427  ORF Transcript_54541/g.119427 Transcript_54541/m.119427 type:complete len:290 (+) Transcript_54541:173-1042(+)